MPSRRKTLQIVASTVLSGYISGCLGFFQNGGVRISINNQDDQQHTVTVTFKREDESVFTDQYVVSSTERMRTDDVVEAGEYMVTVELDSTDAQTIDFHMEGCDSNSLVVSIDEDGGFETFISHEC